MGSNKPSIRPLRVKPQDVRALLDAMDKQARDAKVPASRKLKRWEFRATAAVLMLKSEHNDWSAFAVATRNLSAGGAGLLHEGYAHVGKRCMIGLRALCGSLRTVQGEVVRCRHVSGPLHEIGVKFDERIEPGDFIVFGGAGAIQTERVDESSLKGTLLVLDDNKIDASLFRRHFASTKLKVAAVSDVGEALRLNLGTLDLAVVGVGSCDRPFAALLDDLRAEGLGCPVIALSADRSATVADEAGAAGAACVLHKPVDKLNALQAVAEFVAEAHASCAAVLDTSALGLDPSLFTEAFATLRAYATAIDAALTSNNAAGVRDAANGIHTTSGEIGHFAVYQESGRLLETLDGGAVLTPPTVALSKRVRDLCRRSRAA